MSANRVVFAAVLVAASWTTVISGLVAVGAARAEAAWLKTGPGTGYAVAGTLPDIAKPTLTNPKCNNSGSGPTATLTWTYPAALPQGFEVLTSLTPNSPTNSMTTTNTTTTVSLLSNNKTTYVSVRAAIGAWRGPRSPEVQAC